MIPATANWLTFAGASAKQPIYLLTITGYSRQFSNVLSGQAGVWPWISKISGGGTRANDLDGSSSLSSLQITVLDASRLLTADLAGITLEGRAATLKLGFAGLALADFSTLASLTVDKVDTSDRGASYTIALSDQTILQHQLAYKTGDDGFPTSNKHPHTLAGNPMALLLDILQNQLSLPAGAINSTAIAAYQTGLLGGLTLRFSLTTAPQAKQFIEQELLAPQGGYAFLNSLGQYTPFFWIPYTVPTVALSLTRDDIESVPTPVESPILNVCSFRYDQDAQVSGKMQNEINAADGTSISKYAMFGLKTIQSRGLRQSLGAPSWARIYANALFRRYGYKNLQLSLTARASSLLLEPGDFVRVTHSLIPDRAVGTVGITNRLFEVLEKSPNFAACTAKLKLLDMAWLDAMAQSQVAPDGTPAWTLASSAQKSQYMFVAAQSTGKYSDGSAGKQIF